MQVDWDNSNHSAFAVDNNNNHGNSLNVGKAVVEEYKSSHVLTPYSSKEQPNQLNALTHCQRCLQPFKQPTTLSCGFTSCYDCLPSKEPYQCISFSCLREHNNDYRPNILLENIMNNLQDISIIKQFLDCSICLSPLSDPITTQCGHTFCKECLIRTMTDLKTRSCPFCRHELMRIGKVNQIVSGWIDYAYNNVESAEFTVSAMNSKQHTPIIKVSLTVAFPSQHCLFHINVTNDKSLLLQEMTTRPHQKHYAICVFTKDSNPNEFHDYGIMMQVNHVEYSPDIRHSVVQAFGLFRLKISNLTIDQEGFYVGDITRFDDINHNNDSDFDLQVQTRRWTMPTLSSATTTSISMSRPISTSSSTVTRNNSKQVARPRPCSMRLSSSAPNHIPSFNNIPGSMNRRTWASTMHFGVIKPPSPPPQSPGTTTAQHYFKPPKKSSLKTLNTVPNINFLFNQEIYPRLVQYLSSTSNHAWIMQYNWHLQQSDQETIVWWIANVLPLDQQEKICLLGISTLRERLMAIYHWFDKLQPLQQQQ